MATPRKLLVDPENPLHYHLVSRCVRRSWLCGKQPGSNKSFEHRKIWLRKRLFHLAKCFAVAIDAYAIMSNHFHLVVYYDPQDSYRWPDEEVADRWLSAFPPRMAVLRPKDADEIIALHRALLLSLPEKIQHARETLGSLSMFMKHLKQPIAYQANKEDQCSGHFFEGRFYSGALLDENAVLAAMAYVDLNPVRAKIAQDITKYETVSGADRMRIAKNHPDRLALAVTPLVSGLIDERPEVSMALGTYLQIVEELVKDYAPRQTRNKKSRWFDRITSLKKRQRAFGSIEGLAAWNADRGWSIPGYPLPIV